MTTALAHPREAFPVAPVGGRIPTSGERPTGVRPWGLRFARVPDARQASALPGSVYDEAQQVSLTVDGTLVLCMAGTHKPTTPDGSVKNPPPLDEGPKD
ncbi:putative ATP-grasp-modified RiPP [Streptomyces sp. NPDC055078]